MGENKKFYWLKLKRDFFKRHDIRVIESMPNGKDYLLFYLKLMVESIDHDGALRFSDTIPYNEEMLAAITNTNVDIVRAAMKLFTTLGLVEIFDDQTIYMREVERLTGSETKWAEKKRMYRAKEDIVLALSEPCPTDVRQEIRDKSLEIRDKSLEINKKAIESGDAVSDVVKTVVSYLNSRAGTAYKATGEKTKKLIGARVSEGFTVDDFKIVIDNKVDEWGKPPRPGEKDMRIYIRPETLFGTKFEAYLNQRRVSNDGEHERIGEHLI